MLLVGYGHDTSLGLDYWVLKNSWGVQWGSNGYMRMLRRATAADGEPGSTATSSGLCGLDAFPVIPLGAYWTTHSIILKSDDSEPVAGAQPRVPVTLRDPTLAKDTSDIVRGAESRSGPQDASNSSGSDRKSEIVLWIQRMESLAMDWARKYAVTCVIVALLIIPTALLVSRYCVRGNGARSYRYHAIN